MTFKFSDLNCVVGAISALTGENPNAIIAAIAAAAEDGELAFYSDGCTYRRVYTRYLERQGWRGTWVSPESPLRSIPATCLVIFDGHAFAVKDGALFDTGSGVREGKQILAVYEPAQQGE